MAMYSALRDAFNDINKSVRDQANWEEQHAVEAERRSSERMVIEQNLQDQLLRRDVLKAASMKAIDQITPKDTNVFGLIPNTEINQKEIFGNQQWIDESEQIFGGKWDPSVGGWRGEDGNVLQFTDYHMAKKMAAIEGITQGTFNGPAVWTRQSLELDSEIATTKAGQKKETRAEKKVSTKKLSDLQQQRNKVLEKLNSKNMLLYYSNQYQNQTGKARFFTAMGDTNTAAIMQKRATHAQTNVAELIKQIDKERKGGKGIGTSSAHKVYNISQVDQTYTDAQGKVRKVRPGAWVNTFGHNFKTQGDIMRNAMASTFGWDGSWMGLDNSNVVPKTGTGAKQTGALTFDQGQDNIAKAHTTTGALGQNIINPRKKGQVFAETQIFGAIVSQPGYAKAHGRDHRSAQIEAQSTGRQINNLYFKEKAKGKAMSANQKGRDKLVALILEYAPDFQPTFNKKGRVSNSKIELTKILDTALLQAIDNRLLRITGKEGLGYTPFRK